MSTVDKEIFGTLEHPQENEITEIREMLNGFKKQTSVFAKIETGNKEKEKDKDKEQKVGMVRIKYTREEEKEDK